MPPSARISQLNDNRNTRMPKSQLSQYRGKLDAAQIARGMNAALRNARRLADDAESLLELARYPTATALAILSIEESGKTTILRGLALAPTVERQHELWKAFRSHRSKNVAWIIPRLYLNGARTLDSLSFAADPTAEHTALLDQVKQIALYTDCLGAANWSEPLSVIDCDLAHELVSIADLRAKVSTVTEREIELWIEIMGPTYGEPLDRQKVSLAKWYDAMREHGLWEDGPVSVENFLWGNDA